MTGEQIVGLVVALVCYGGSGILFYGIGVWAEKRKAPMHFYAGTTIDPGQVLDIPAYNRANGSMWKWYSTPWFLGGLLSVLAVWYPWLHILGLILAALASTVGLWWLVRTYKGIEKEYIDR